MPLTNCSEDLSPLQCDVWLTPVLLNTLVDVPLIEIIGIGAVKLQALLASVVIKIIALRINQVHIVLWIVIPPVRTDVDKRSFRLVSCE